MCNDLVIMYVGGAEGAEGGSFNKSQISILSRKQLFAESAFSFPKILGARPSTL
jgi:hypothetical protein